MTPSADSSDLSRYPRPSLAVDVALLTLVPGPRPHVGVVVVRPRRDPDGTGWRLPGTFVHEGETLADAVRRVLCDKAGLVGVEPRQLRVFDDPRRDPRGWVVSVAHTDTVRPGAVEGHAPTDHDVDVAPIEGVGADAHAYLPDDQEALPYDHAAILVAAIEDLQRRYLAAPDPAGFLDEPFLLRQLHQVHLAVEGTDVHKDTFRRRVLEQLEPVGEPRTERTGRPAQPYRRRPAEGGRESVLPRSTEGAEPVHARLEQHGVSTAITAYVEEVHRAVGVVVANSTSRAYIALHHGPGARVALYVHKTYVDIALPPERAQQVAGMTGARTIDRKTTVYVHVTEALLADDVRRRRLVEAGADAVRHTARKHSD